MTATKRLPHRLPHRQSGPKPRAAATRPVPELLLELAYRLHATRVIARAPAPARR